eukprot:4188508-Prymnesium_polylepis.2
MIFGGVWGGAPESLRGERRGLGQSPSGVRGRAPQEKIAKFRSIIARFLRYFAFDKMPNISHAYHRHGLNQLGGSQHMTAMNEP